MPRRAASELVAGSNNSRLSKKVMPPQFSMAPPNPPGTAIKSSLGSGYFTPKYSSYQASSLTAFSSAKRPCPPLPAVVTTPTVTPSDSAVMRSSSPAVSTNR